MFENKDKSQPVTIGDFQEFADMVVNNFATKEDFNGLSRELRGEMTAMKGEFTEMKNEILNSNDKLVKELDTFLTEKTVLGGQLKEQGDRVTVIEKHVGIEPARV